MLINVRVNDEKQALKFVNDVLKDLNKDEVSDMEYKDEDIEISPELKSFHTSEGPKDITIESTQNLAIIVGDLDFKTQEVVKTHMNKLHRL